MIDLATYRTQFAQIAKTKYELALADHTPRNPSSARVVRLLGDWYAGFSGGGHMDMEPVEMTLSDA